jgi:hypothetical protein
MRSDALAGRRPSSYVRSPVVPSAAIPEDSVPAPVAGTWHQEPLSRDVASARVGPEPRSAPHAAPATGSLSLDEAAPILGQDWGGERRSIDAPSPPPSFAHGVLSAGPLLT